MKGVANIATTWVVFLGLLTGPWPGEVAGQANDSACVDSSLDRNGNVRASVTERKQTSSFRRVLTEINMAHF